MEFKKIPKDKRFDIKKLGTQRNIEKIVEVIKEKIEIYQCKVDIIVSVDVSGSVGYEQFLNYLYSIGVVNSASPPSPLAVAQNDLVSSLITQFSPFMSSGDLQMGICTWSTASYHMANSGGPANGFHPSLQYSGTPIQMPNVIGMQQTASGMWLSNDPVELDVVAQNITGDGGTAQGSALNLSLIHI